MELLLARWRALTAAEQRQAVLLTRTMAAHLLRSAVVARSMGGNREIEAARPCFYAQWVLRLWPDHAEAPFWREAESATLVQDRRVCAFGAVWERQRQQLLPLPSLPGGRAGRGLAVLDAGRRRERAAWHYREACRTLAGLDPVPLGHEARLRVGHCRVALMGADDNYWRAIMLYRDAAYRPMREFE